MHRSISTTTTPRPQPGSGILHPFPTTELAHVDPFVFLDTGEPRHLGPETIYVPPHPHRGVTPVSLLFRGRITHRDSLGNHATVGSGGMQWLVAGTGALHEELLGGDDDGWFHMAQLWVNVPSHAKHHSPDHRALRADEIPVVDAGDGSTLRIYAGAFGAAVGPAPTVTPMLVGLATIDAGGSLTLPAPPEWTAAVTVVDGVATTSATKLAPGGTAVFAHDGDEIELESTDGAEVLVMVGEPIGEPVVVGGGFVMTNEADIATAFADHARGAMGTLEPQLAGAR
ncbi:MAG: pirin family protein [Actinomycetota bacterium]